MPRNPNKAHCQHPGCRAWAVRAPSLSRAPLRAPEGAPEGNTDGPSPPLCAAHKDRRAACPEPSRRAACPEPSRKAACPEPSRRAACPEPSRKGACPEPSRKGACPEPSRRGAPPGNQNARIHGFYASTLNPDELADLAVIGQLAGDTTLDAEIVITRIALRRLLHMFQTGTTPGPDPQPLTAQDYANVIGLAFRGCGTLSRLLRARKELGGEQNDAFHAFMDKTLDLLSEEWGRQL